MSRRPLTLALVAILTLLLGSSTATAEQSAGQERSRFLGSVPTGQATGTALPLSLKDAFDRALTYNLGLIESDQNARAARAVRLRNLSALLPDVSARVSGTRQQIDLRALGFGLSLPGVSLPTIVGPFNVADARVYVSQPIFNWSDIQQLEVGGRVRASVAAHLPERSRHGGAQHRQRLPGGDF